MKIFKVLSILCIKVYGYTIGKMIPHKCAFTPNCSAYTITAIKRFGATKGIWLGFKRICRCNPKNHGKIDNVPQNLKGDYKWLM